MRFECARGVLLAATSLLLAVPALAEDGNAERGGKHLLPEKSKWLLQRVANPPPAAACAAPTTR